MSVTKKQIPIGISDFRTIIEQNYYYVDKTMLIRDLYKPGQVMLVPRPRRFGKTLNLSMLRYFFEKDHQSTEHLFHGTAIWQDEEMRQYQGQYPTIFISFKNIKETSWDSCKRMLALTIAEEYKRHERLVSLPTIDDHEKKIFRSIAEVNATDELLKTSFQYLVKLLNKATNKKVVLIIDEYDVPIQSAYLHNFYDEAIEFLKTLLTSALKDNPLLEIGVLSGILTLAKAGIFSGLNNLNVFNLTNDCSADKFGFTHKEVDALINYYGISDPHKSIEQWYDGYTFGHSTLIFNPWSVLKCVSEKGSLQKYWAKTSDNALIKKIIARSNKAVKMELESLLQGKTVEMVIEESMTFPELNIRAELVWSLLLFTGYITYTHYEVKEGSKVAALTIPNEEIKHLYNELINQIFEESLVDASLGDFLQALTEGDVNTITVLQHTFVTKSMSHFGIPNNEPEKSYHLFVLGLVVNMSNYVPKSNRESGLGRYDIMLMPKEGVNLPAIVIEFKKVLPGETLKSACTRALDQIKDKKYIQELEEHNYRDIKAYGIAFEGKNVLAQAL